MSTRSPAAARRGGKRWRLHVEGRAPRLVDSAREHVRGVERIGQQRVDLEDAPPEAPLEVMAHLVEDGVHPVAVERHRHAVGVVRHADGLPRREPDAHGLPPAREAADVVRVHVHREIRVGDVAAHLDGIAVLRRHPEIDDLVAVLGVMADESRAELAYQRLVEQPRELGGPAHPVQGVRTHERDLRGRHAGGGELVEHGTDRDGTDRAERPGGVVVERDRDARAGLHQLADARESDGAPRASRTAASRSSTGGSAISAALERRRVSSGRSAVRTTLSRVGQLDSHWHTRREVIGRSGRGSAT